MNAEQKPAEAGYGADNLQHLSDLEHVRERPSMYIGDTAARGLHHLVYEIVDNGIDEAMAGFCDRVTVTMKADGVVAIFTGADMEGIGGLPCGWPT